MPSSYATRISGPKVSLTPYSYLRFQPPDSWTDSGVISEQAAQIADLEAKLAAMTLERDQLQQTSEVNAKMASDYAGIARQATAELKKRGALVDDVHRRGGRWAKPFCSHRHLRRRQQP